MSADFDHFSPFLGSKFAHQLDLGIVVAQVGISHIGDINDRLMGQQPKIFRNGLAIALTAGRFALGQNLINFFGQIEDGLLLFIATGRFALAFNAAFEGAHIGQDQL